MSATLFATVFLPLEFAILAGMMISFARYIIKTSTPEVYPAVPNPSFQHFIPQFNSLPCWQLGVISIGGSLYFGATQHVEDCIRENLEKFPEQKYLLIRMSMVDHLDVSGVHMLEAVVRLYRKRGGDVFLTGLRPAVKSRLVEFNFDSFIANNPPDSEKGDNANFHFLEMEDAIPHLFHRVLDPSVCIYECDRRVFAECQPLPKFTYPHAYVEPVEFPEYLVNQFLPSELLRKITSELDEEKPILIDVREESEYQNGHIPNSRLIPLRTIPVEGGQLPKDLPLILICRSGRRSTMAAQMLHEMGYTKVYNMKGGMLAWEAAGYPVAVE